MKLDNKGYMLIEIVLALFIAFGIIFFIADLTIKLKNKNDDLLVETMMNTDKTIISNKLMDYAKSETKDFECDELKIDKDEKVLKYRGKVITTINEYADIGELICENSLGEITVKLNTDVLQMPDKEFDILFNYKYEIGDMIPPKCSLSVSDSGVITATYYDNEDGSGISGYGFNAEFSGENTNTTTINRTGDYTFYVKDYADNSATCKISVINPTTYQTGSRCIWYTHYCNFECRRAGATNYTYTNIEGCRNPSPNYCYQSASWSVCGHSVPTYGIKCDSGYKMTNNTYCYKQIL